MDREYLTILRGEEYVIAVNQVAKNRWLAATQVRGGKIHALGETADKARSSLIAELVKAIEPLG